MVFLKDLIRPCLADSTLALMNPLPYLLFLTLRPFLLSLYPVSEETCIFTDPELGFKH